MPHARHGANVQVIRMEHEKQLQALTSQLQSKGLTEDQIKTEYDQWVMAGTPPQQAITFMAREHSVEIEGVGTTGAIDVDRLEVGQENIHFTATIQTAIPRDTQTGKMTYGMLKVGNQTIAYSAFRNNFATPNSRVEISGANVGEWNNNPQVVINERCQVTVLESGDSRDPVLVRIGDIAEDTGICIVEGRITNLERIEKNVKKPFVAGMLADATGVIPFTCWDDKFVHKQGDAVRIEDAVPQLYRGSLKITFTTKELPAATTDIPAVEVLPTHSKYTLADLQDATYFNNAEVEGVVVVVREASGLIDRCANTECNRVLKERNCTTHGQNDGTPDLQTVVTLDDGTGTVIATVRREQTEAWLGKTLAQCQEEARAAMDKSVINKQLDEALMGRFLVLQGSGNVGDYGARFYADNVTEKKVDGRLELERSLKALETEVLA